MKIDIICPLYNAEKDIERQFKQIQEQSIYEKINNIRYIVTASKDNTLDIVKKISKQNKKVRYKQIEVKDFNHALTRENEAKESDAEIIVYITQDIIIENRDWLEKLIQPIEKGEAEASYSRQICNDKDSIEFYTRQKNYPGESIIKSKSDIDKLGINTFFYSDASSAIKSVVFRKLNWYDNKKLPTNEDMYIAHKLIMNNFKIKYCADSEVIHSHNFTLKETYSRYKTYGEFLKQEPQLNIKSAKAGGGLAKFILMQAIKDKNFKILIGFMPNMIARYIGMMVGKNKKQ